jgi:hypothetical protein
MDDIWVSEMVENMPSALVARTKDETRSADCACVIYGVVSAGHPDLSPSHEQSRPVVLE